ncbi:MAG: tripartite tricarboxylate transporter substrate binding protein [Betaproteobacteria bacterium]
MRGLTEAVIAAIGAAAGLLLVLVSNSVIARDYPQKPIRFVVGPGPDALARTVGQKLTDAWGQQIVIDQRPGAGGSIAADIVARARGDGYTLLLATGSHTINAALQKQSYDLARDFRAVSLVGSVPFILVVHPSLPVHSVKELIDLARARPGELNYGSAGNGTPPHLAGEMLKTLTGVKLVHVPYKTAAQAMTDVLSGQPQLMFAVAPVGLPQVRAGRVRGIAVSTAQRSRMAPELPTLAEAGVPGFDVIGWNGVLAPAGTPSAVVNKLYAGLETALKLPDVVNRLAATGFEPVGSTPEVFAEFVRTDIARWTRVIRDAGIKMD